MFKKFDLAAFPSRAEYQLAFHVSVRLAKHLRVWTVAAAVVPNSPCQDALDHIFERMERFLLLLSLTGLRVGILRPSSG